MRVKDDSLSGLPSGNLRAGVRSNSAYSVLVTDKILRQRVPGREPCGRFEAVLTPLMMALFLTGCATGELGHGAPPREDLIQEYRQITEEAQAAVSSALSALEKVNTPGGRPAPKKVAALASAVQQLQVKSLRVRARADAILARGDAYFAAWSENVARIQDEQVRESAERFRPELEDSFSKIKFASQHARAAFEPFLSGLRELRTRLECQPDQAESDSTAELIHTTREQGWQVVHDLGTIRDELQAMTHRLKPGKSTASK